MKRRSRQELAQRKAEREAKPPKLVYPKDTKGKKPTKKKSECPSEQTLDTLFSLVVRGMANNECQFWGMDNIRCSQQMNCMHLKSRRFRCIRWDMDNAVCGCVAHHQFYTDHPDCFFRAVETRWPGRWDLVQAKWIDGKKPMPDRKREIAAALRLTLAGFKEAA